MVVMLASSIMLVMNEKTSLTGNGGANEKEGTGR